MVDPMPTFDGSEAANLKILLNAIISAVEAYVGESIDEVLGKFFAETVEDLPDTGNTKGQITYVGDVQRVYICTELPATWVRLDQLGYATTTPTMGAGFDNVDFNDLLRQGGFAYYQVNARTVSGLGVNGTIAEIPSGYQGDLHDWRAAWAFVSETGVHSFYKVYYNPIAQEIQAGQSIPAGTYIAASFTWPLR